MHDESLQFTLFCAISLLFVQSTTSVAAPPRKDQLIGTWRLISIEDTMVDGTTGPDRKFGLHPLGYLMYEADGHMCAEIMNANLSWTDPKNPTEKEKLDAFDGFIAYCGTFELNAAQSTVIHHPDVAWMPPYVGTVQPRPFRLTGNRLIITPKPTDPDVSKMVLTWEKIK